MAESREWTYDGVHGELVARTWQGPGEPARVVVVAHGYGEHVGRYEHLADKLVAGGAVVYAVDHAGTAGAPVSGSTSTTSRTSSPICTRWTGKPGASIPGCRSS